ncbi:MAG: PIN domain-containing protein [Chloroflexi bacterium]|nr:PIN domain-containing protein [Chloroflexota bacterium]
MHTFLTTFPNLIVLPMDLQVATSAATLRAMQNVSVPDAVIVASGLLTGCEAIVSNDEEWRRRLQPLFPQFKWVYLADHL